MKLVAKACCALRRAGLGVAFIAVLLACGGALAQSASHIEQAQWQTTPGGGFGPLPPLPALDEAAWQAVALPFQVARGATQDAIDTAWFRLRPPPGARAGDKLNLYVPRWQTIGRVAVYADGRLAWRSGGGPVWNGFNHPLWIPLDDRPGPDGRPPELLVRIDHLRGSGLSLSTAWVGPREALAPSRFARDVVQVQLPYVASTAFLVIGLFALLVWVARREPAYGLFFVCSALFFIRTLHFHMGEEPLPISDTWFGWWTVHAMSGLAIGICSFSMRLAGSRMHALEWGAILLAGGAAVAGLPPLAATSPAQAAPLLYGVTLLVFVALAALALRCAWQARSREALLVAALNAANIPVGLHDWLLQNHRIDPENVYLLPLTSAGLFSAFLYIVLTRYVHALRQSEQAQQQLERELRAREAELTATYDRLRAAERKEILGAERERLMQDMHDGLGSSLMSALKTAEYKQLDELAEVLRQCIDDLKLTIDSMEPVEADLLLLLGTLRFRLGTRLRHAGVQLHWEVDDIPALPWLDPRSSLQVLRILQEIFTNILKHSGARNARVSTSAAGGEVLVAVEDDGVGLDAARGPAAGRGLLNVRRRAQSIGAQAQWSSRPGCTRFELRLPLARGAGVDGGSEPALAAGT